MEAALKVPTVTPTPANTQSTGFVNGVAGDVLLRFIQRLENLEQQKSDLLDDIKEVYAEAKGQGFDPKIVKKIISLRKRERADVEEEQTMLEIYLRAIGMMGFSSEEEE